MSRCLTVSATSKGASLTISGTVLEAAELRHKLRLIDDEFQCMEDTAARSLAANAVPSAAEQLL